MEAIQAAVGPAQLVSDWPGLRQPRQLAVEQLLDSLGISPLAPPAVLEVARRAHEMPYPPNWSEEHDAASGAIYFYNSLIEEASWQHPLTETLQEIIEFVTQLVTERATVRAIAAQVEQKLEQAQLLATQELADWVGPVPSNDGEDSQYYYNRRTDQSEWEDPRERWKFKLQVRYELLVGYLVSEERASVAHFGTGIASHDRAFENNLTPTLTSLASSMSSIKSVLDNSLTAPPQAGSATDDDELNGCWAQPRPRQHGALPLPPRATDPSMSGRSSRVLYSIAPHQKRYASDVLQQECSSPDRSPPSTAGSSARRPNGYVSGNPPPPPPGFPPPGTGKARA